MAEYEALLSGLRIAIELGIKRLDVRGDSQLVIDQVMKESSCHDPKMEAYCNVVRRLEDRFDGLELNHVPRKYNEDADELAKIASRRTTVPPKHFCSRHRQTLCQLQGSTGTGPLNCRALQQEPLGGRGRAYGDRNRDLLGGRG